MRRTRLIALVFLALFISTAAWAAVPQTLHYSGKLDTAGGSFNGTADVTFALYADANAATSFWSDSQAVTVTNGRFHVELGPLSAADVDVSALQLGVTVGADDEMDKVAIASVPYALRAVEAGNAATVGGQAATDFAAASHSHALAELEHPNCTSGQVLTSDGSGWACADAVKGDQGDTGPVGPTGATGDTGAAGAAGPIGATGPKGAKGDTGPVGPTGAKGDTGAAGAAGAAGAIGATGPKGPKGDTGAAGAAGPIGATGPKGNTGAAGAAGVPGDTGPTGPKGAKGDKGAAGPPGATGAAGSVGGGLYSVGAWPTFKCLHVNPATGGCSCPAGFGGHLIHTGDSSGVTEYLYLCW